MEKQVGKQRKVIQEKIISLLPLVLSSAVSLSIVGQTPYICWLLTFRAYKAGIQCKIIIHCEISCRALVSYGFGNLHWAATHVISMAGAFCAGVAVYGFRAANDDVHGWQVRMPHIFLFKCLFVRSALSVQPSPMGTEKIIHTVSSQLHHVYNC